MAGILVYFETTDSNSAPASSYDLLALAQCVGRDTGWGVTAAVVGSASDSLKAQIGPADDVVVIDGSLAAEESTPETRALGLHAYVAQMQPELVLIGNSTVGLDLAPALAVQCGYPLVAYCVDLTAGEPGIEVKSQLYGGRLYATLNAKSPLILTVNQGATYGKAPVAWASNPAGKASAFDTPWDATTRRTKVVEVIQPDAGAVDITQADKLVCVGRGVGDRDKVAAVEELAQALGAEVASSRPLVDAGWMPKERQVGKSGLTVKPKLYLALGVSGAPEHLQGMSSAELIVAVNSDKEAPIFHVAHYGVVGDMFDVMPALLDALAGEG